jgi:hypothetical protein
MERGNDIVQPAVIPAAMPATTANVGNVSGSVGNMSADVGGFDMGGINVTAAGGGARGGTKSDDKGDKGDEDETATRDERPLDPSDPGPSGT